jgi:hypothetical protein
MGFLRYINMQPNDSKKKEEGQKLIDRIFSIEKFKVYENQSLQLLDHESIIYDEGGASKAHEAFMMKTMSRVAFKDADIEELYRLIVEQDLEKLRQFFESFKFGNFLMFRGTGSKPVEYKKYLPSGTFETMSVPQSKLNLY